MLWYRFYGGDWLSDPKVMLLSAGERMCFVTLMCIVSANDSTDGSTIISEKKLMLHSGVDPDSEEWDRIKGVLVKLEKLGFVTLSDTDVTDSDKQVTLANWVQRQWIVEDSRVRMRRHRAKKREENENSVTTKSQNPSESVSASASESKKEVEDRFDLFWSAYPKKVAKKKAQQIWMRLKPSEDLTKRIIADVEARAKTDSWKKEKRKYVPHPTTYLNQERWEDEDAEDDTVSKKYREKGL